MEGLLTLIIFLGLHLFFSYCFKLICQKAGTEPGILIWVPFLQVIPLMQAAELESWKIVLFFVPVYNVIFVIIMWVKVLKAINQNPWLVILLLAPIINMFFIPYLAFSSNLTQSEISSSGMSSSGLSSSGMSLSGASSSGASSSGASSSGICE